MKIVGVIGGMGPKATIDFLHKIIAKTDAKKDQDHIKMVVYMNPQVPDRSEAILDDKESPKKSLIESAKLLENAGAHFIVMPCVTAHYWLEAMRNSVSIPVLDLVELTLEKITKKMPKLKNIGILTTNGTLKTRLFENIFEPEGLKVIAPAEEIQQNYVMKAIYHIKKGENPETVKPLFLHACNHLTEKSAQVIVAACTEVPLSINQNDVEAPFIDVNEVLAEETLKRAL